jgi:RimJ/RimL family protein N-acetyltransferase
MLRGARRHGLVGPLVRPLVQRVAGVAGDPGPRDPVVAKYLSAEGLPWTIERMESALDQWIDLFETRQLGKLRVTRKSDGVLVGRCGYSIHGPTQEPELGYALYPEFWGKGYATEAAAGQRDWIFRETQVPRILGFAHVDNAASRRVLRTIGMRETKVAEDSGMTVQFHELRRDELNG